MAQDKCMHVDYNSGCLELLEGFIDCTEGSIKKLKTMPLRRVGTAIPRHDEFIVLGKGMLFYVLNFYCNSVQGKIK